MSLFLLALIAATSGPASLVGEIRVAQGVGAPPVYLETHKGKKAVELTGAPLAELRRLPSAKVRVVGLYDGDRFVVRAYGILDVGGGVQPLVGFLGADESGALMLHFEAGSPKRLTMSPRSKRRLSGKMGAKVWLYGPQLLSGEIRVRRYGVLRELNHGVQEPTRQGESSDPQNGKTQPLP